MNLFSLICLLVFYRNVNNVLCEVSFPGSKDLVASLPGLTFPINYRHYSGYLSSDNGTELHYWFFESQSGQPEKDPLVLWLNGGPGCSSMLGAMTEMGPLYLDKTGKLVPNNYAWNSKANIIFLETPAGVGFSYRSDATGENYTTRVYKTSDRETATLNLNALRNFYEKFPQFAKNPFFIAGESYAGIYIPTLAVRLIEEKFPSNFQGVAIGNGLLDEALLGSSLIHFGYYHALIDTAMYRNVLQKCCSTAHAQSFEFDKCNIVAQEQDLACTMARGQASEKLRFFSPINPYNIYGKCIKDDKISPFGEEFALPSSSNRIHPDQITAKLLDSQLGLPPNPLLSEDLPAPGGGALRNSPQCVNFDHLEAWLNSEPIKKALNIRVNASKAWVPCSFDVSVLYERQYNTVANEIKNLVNSGKRVLIYNGDVDSVCNFIGDQWFVDSLGFKATTPYSPWEFEGQVAGFTTHYEHNLTFTTVRGAGHTVPEDKPAEAKKMFEDFLVGK